MHFPVHPVPAPVMAKSAPVTPTAQVAGSMNVGYRECRHGGFFEGLLGCLRPMWTIIGKATSTELKQQSELSFCLAFGVYNFSDRNNKGISGMVCSICG